MKKPFFLVLVLLLLTCTLLSAAAALADGNPPTLPATGDKIGGFVVRSITPYDVIGATGVLFEHEKNGAKLLYLASEDTNVAFDITFRTPALDDKGKPHVLEHMLVSGSQKYPDANLFLPFISQTYKTYVNAHTYPDMTTYPVSSLSEDQLMTLMDYYLSGVFMPLLYTEPRLAEREAWRYHLSSAEDPQTIAGTVYSEMQGEMTFGGQHALNVRSTLFKDGLTAHDAGGLPEAIRALTYDELVAYHEAYYHPSNALIVLYGKLDYEKFISYIDTAYVSSFDRQEIYVERGKVTPYTETAYATYDAPVEQGARSVNATSITYAFASNDISLEDVLGLSVLRSLLSAESSTFMRMLGERLPGVVGRCSLDIYQPAPLLTFTAEGANEADRDTFVRTVDESIAQMLAEGISQEALEATLASTKLNLMLTPENSILGVDVSRTIASYWAYFDSLDFYNAHEKVVDSITADDLTALMKKYVADNPYRGVCVTRPAPGKTEENAARLADELAAKKAALSEQEIAELVDQTERFAQWSAAPVDEQILSQLVCMTVDKLPENLPECEVTDEMRDGVRYITAEADVVGVAKNCIALDASRIPVERLKDANIYLALLGYIGTETYSREELGSLIPRYLGELSIALSAENTFLDDQTQVYTATISSVGLTENAQKGMALLEEILLRTDLTQVEEIQGFLAQGLYSARAALDNPLATQKTRCAAVFAPAYAFNAYVDSIGMYDYLQEMIALADSDPAAFTARLEGGRNALLHKTGATVLCAGSDEAIAAYTKASGALLAKLPQTQAEPADFSKLLLSMTSEAVVNSATVHMNMTVAPAGGFSGKEYVLSALIRDRYLGPKLRNALGAYDLNCILSRTYDYLCTYRDPNFEETYDVFAALPEQMRTDPLSQQDVDSYIIGSYGMLVYTQGKLSEAFTAANDRRIGLTNEIILSWIRAAKSTTVEDVRAAADRVENLVNTGIRSTSGSESFVTAHQDAFDSIVKIGEE